MKKKNIFICLLLTVVTLGFYSIFWTVDLMFQTSKCFKNKTYSVLWKILFTILTGGLYSVYWVYQIGKEMSYKSKLIIDKGAIYAVLMFFAIISDLSFTVFSKGTSYINIGIGFIYEIVVISLIQKDLNLLIDKKLIK